MLGPTVQHLCLSVTVITVTHEMAVDLANDGQSVSPSAQVSSLNYMTMKTLEEEEVGKELIKLT